MPLSDEHNVDNFECGELSLDDWLKRRARRNEGAGASRTFVVCDGLDVTGYYCLAAGGVTHTAVPNRVKRNMPDPIPVIVLGRLAVDRRYQASGIGRGLLRDAMLRTVHLAREVGIRAILVHAISDDAKQFYLKYAFIESPIDSMTLFLPVETIKRGLDTAP